MDHADPRYLLAKRSVDERAFARPVQEAVQSRVPPAPRILEVGCGVGTTVPRLLEWGLEAFTYRGVDLDERAIAFARTAIPKELRREGHAVDPTPTGFRTANATVEFAVDDALAFLRTAPDADLIVAQAFLDLVPIEPTIEAIESALAPGGVAYLPITFDGGTYFAPPHPDDQAVQQAYHAAIDEIEGQESRAGRRLLELLERRPGTLLAARSADWIVRPGDQGYPLDERYFLERILSFVRSAVEPAYEDWLETRSRQLAAEELVYVAHQYDLAYQGPE